MAEINMAETPGTEPRGGGGDLMPNEGESMIHINGKMIGGRKLSKGDKVSFKCMGDMDEDGDYPCSYENDGDGDEWASGLRHEMSPRNGDKGGGY
jgi:hypothetical protein